MTSAAIGDLISGGGDTEPGILVGLVIFFAGTALASGYLAKRKLLGSRSIIEDTAHKHETIVLELALKHDGRLTIAQIAALTPLSVDDAKTALQQLSLQGVAELEFDAQGDIFYAFGGLRSPKMESTYDAMKKTQRTQSEAEHTAPAERLETRIHGD